jgi:hypothetical protein
LIDECRLAVSPDIADKHAAYLDANAAGWWWPTADWVIVCATPQEIHRRRIGPDGWRSHQLHRLDGPAISYRDGWALWFVEGVQMDQASVEFPESITVERIKAEDNAERRRILMRSFGPDVKGPRDADYDGTLGYLRAVGSKLIDADGGTRAIGSAPRCLIEIDDAEWPRWLVLTDGSTTRVYCIPAERSDDTVSAAVQRINGGIPDDAIYAES